MSIAGNIKHLSAIALLVTGICGSAQAEEMSAISQATADIKFLSTSTAFISITPQNELTAGQHSSDVIMGQYSARVEGDIAVAPYTVAVRWANQNDVQNCSSDKAQGKGLSCNQIIGAHTGERLDVAFTYNPGHASASATPGWIYGTGNTTGINGDIIALNNVIAPDVYTLTMEAVVWVE